MYGIKPLIVIFLIFVLFSVPLFPQNSVLQRLEKLEKALIKIQQEKKVLENIVKKQDDQINALKKQIKIAQDTANDAQNKLERKKGSALNTLAQTAQNTADVVKQKLNKTNVWGVNSGDLYFGILFHEF